MTTVILPTKYFWKELIYYQIFNSKTKSSGFTWLEDWISQVKPICNFRQIHTKAHFICPNSMVIAVH